MSDDEYPILPFYGVFYLQAMLFNTHGALSSLDRVVTKLEGRLGEPWDSSDGREVLDGVQSIATHAAALARYFWPADKRYKSRGDHLRKVFKVDESSSLFDRELRNSLEHFDERLDDYLRHQPMGMFYPEYVGPTFSDNGVPTHRHRAYFTDTDTFVVLGKKFRIDPICIEVARVHELANDRYQKGIGLSSPNNQ